MDAQKYCAHDLFAARHRCNTAASTNDKPIRGTDIGEVDTMASIEATHDVRSGEEHKVGEANQPSIEFPSPPALSRARANSHFSIRPALAALQNTFGGRQRAHSVSDDASQCSSPRSPMFARFAGLDPRSRTSSSVTIAPPGAKAHSSTLTLPIIESPDENISCAPRIPSFHDLDANLFSQDLGLTLGFNPRFSVASTSTVRAQEGRSMNTWYLQDSHMSVHSDGNSTLASLSDPQMHPDDLPRGVGQALPLSAESVDGALTRPTEPPMPGSASSHASGNIDENGLDTETTRYPEPLSSDLSPAQPNIEASTSHAAQVQNLYLESVSTGGIIPSPVPLSPVSTGLISPARSVAVVSPTRDRSFVTVSPARSAVAVSPTGSTLAPAPMGSTSPVAMPTYNSYISSGSTSPSHPTMAPVPFPSGTEDNEYGSDDASGVYARGSSYSRSDAGYDTPTLYTGTTNTSPTLSVTRIGGGEAPPALRLGPGTGFAGVGTFAAGGNVQGGVFREAGIEGAGMAGMTPLTVDGGLSVGEDESVDRLAENSCLSPNAESSARSLRAESTGRSLHAESSGRSVNAESSGRSVAAESSIGSGIRARVTSLRASQALSVLVPAFMKRARRKSHRMEEMERPKRGRKESNAKRTPDEAESSNARAESNHVYESSRAPSMSSLHPVSDEEEGKVSPTSSHLDLLSADPFASTVALKVGAWSQMYANRSDPSSAPLPPVDSADHQLEAHSECSGSMYGDDDSEEETSIRIYSHGRGRSMSQPDVYTIPIEPLHQSTTKRSGRSLDRRHRLGNWRRPALTARPSLPSLSTLTRQIVVVPIPRSAAAARFPAEPWDDTPCKASPLSSRGLGSLSLPRASPSPARGLSYPRSPMRSPMKMSSESSIAEDEEEEDEDEGDHRILSGDDDKVWWSGPSSRGSSSRRSSIVSNDEPTVSLSDPIVRDTLTTVQPRDSVMSTDLAPVARDSLISTTSHEEIDVSSESFLQTLDALDSLNLPSTPAPSSRTSSESSQGSTMSGQLAMGFGPRRAGGAGGAYGGDYQQGGGHGWQGGQSYGYNSGHGNGGNGNKPRRQADTESSESTSESESDDPPRRGRDARGPTMAMRSQSMPRQAMSSRAVKRQPAPARDSSDESDNVPLAQRLPTALKAQKSIRIQDKAEREERRQRRMDRIKQRAADKAAPTGGEGGVAPDELAKRLLSVQVGGPERSHDRSPMPSPRSPMRMATEQSGGLYAGGTRSRTVSNVSHLTRSRTHTRNGSAEQAPAPPLPTANTTSLSRSGTMSGRRPSAPDIAPPLPSAKPTLSRNGTMSRQRSSQDQPRPGLSRNGTMAKHRGGSKTDDEGESSRFTRSRSIRDPSSARPPMPPMPPMESLPVSARRPSQPEPFVPQVIEQRIYIGDRQRFVVIDIGSPSTTAKDILDIAKQRGELELGGAGGWQLWEQSNECGMERPVRDFELISDVLKAWNPEKRVNVLIIRRSQLCGLLKPENMPSSSPVMSGWVMWVSKPGKWSKRWLELKEHGLFVSKNEKGKDRNHLCSLSHFDGYIVTHVPRAPKGYVFAAKSTDIAGVFEKEEDSSHVFSCDGEIGQVWLTKILLARSYVIQQERNVITRPANFGGGLHASKSMLSRSGTKKSTVSSRTAASQQQQGPLVTDLYSSPFNEGSLLAKHGN